MILPLYAIALALLGAHVLLGRRGRRAASALAFALCCACSAGLAWLGADFSPSFTMIFLAIDLSLCALAELAALAGRSPGAKGWAKRALDALHGLPFALGTLFALPAVFIYAAGDDWINPCMLAALIGGTLLAAGIALLCQRRGRALRTPRLALAWFALCAACFALACALHSPALLPYGAGLLLMAAPLAMESDGCARTSLFALGMALASVMPVAPML